MQKTKKIINLLSIGIIIGFITGSIDSLCRHIIPNQYIQYKMFKLIAFTFQRALNSNILFFSAMFLVLYILWYLFVEKMKNDKNKVMQFMVIAGTILVTFLFIEYLLEWFTRYTLLLVAKRFIIRVKDLLGGEISFNHFLFLLKKFIKLIIILVGGSIIMLFLYQLFRRLEWEKISKIIKIRYIRKVGLVLAIFLFILNLGIVIGKLNVPEGPNIILIYLDALRPDHLGCYGYHRDTSPNIDYLSRRGVLFKNVFSQAPMTYASVSSTLTSKYASHFFNTKKGLFEKKHLTLAEILKNNGYYTMAISSSPFITEKATYSALGGFGQGFDVFDGSVCSGRTWNWQWRSPEGVIEKCLAWLDKNYKKKFFLFLYIMDPHSEYHSPEPYNSLYDPDYIGKRDVVEGNPLSYEWKIVRGIDVDLSGRDIKHLIALYDGEITYADAQIEKLIESLRQLNLINCTLIVLMSDHGEEFFEHGGLQHCFTLYNESIKIPLILHYPEFLPQGVIVDEAIIQSIDIVPTILNIANINKPPMMQGESLLPLLEEENTNWRGYAFSETPFVDAKAIVTKRWKYIHHFETPLVKPDICDKYTKGKELYNLEEDPRELFNLYSKKSAIVKKLYSKIMEIIPDFERDRLEENLGIEFDQEIIEKFKSLGYLQ